MSFDIISEPITLPRLNKDKLEGADVQAQMDEVTAYLTQLVKVLQENFLKAMVNLLNLQLQIMNVGQFVFDLPNADGVYSAGAVRLIKTAANTIEMQVTDSNGDWLTGTSAMAVWSY